MRHVFKKQVFLTALVLAILVAGVTVGFAGQSSENPITNLNLSGEQLNALRGVVHEFNTKQFEILTDIEHKFLELELELKKEDRFETKTNDGISGN